MTPRFTRRELDVLQLICERWYTNKELASHLFIEERTVKFHISRLLKKVGVTGRHELRDWVRADSSHLR